MVNQNEIQQDSYQFCESEEFEQIEMIFGDELAPLVKFDCPTKMQSIEPDL